MEPSAEPSGSREDLRDARPNALAEEFAEAHRRGERPSISEYTERNPDLADRIREVFSGILLLEDVKGLPSTALPP